jgi:hypothetical protein
MKAKLIKTNNGVYDLFEDTRFISTTDSPDGTINKLSIKNCQAIERGYDLEELAVNYANAELSKEFTSKVGNFYGFSSSYIEGFKKALELLEDKKFSEKDLLKSLHKLADSFIRGYPYHQDLDFQEGNQIIQSLQQTEWDVEIEMECPQCQEWGYVSECRKDCNKKFLQPKLDSNGCLILKRIE